MKKVQAPSRIFFSDSLKSQRIKLVKRQHLTCIFFVKRECVPKRQITFELKGNGTRLDVFCMIIGKNEQTFNFEIEIIHSGKETKSSVTIKNALFGNSKVNFKGNIIIEKTGQLADAYLAHHTLLLSDKASAKSIPALEIKADDVKAGHAATIGKVDDDLLFYLTSRGLSAESAKKIFIQGFFESVIERIGDNTIAARLRKNVIKLLP